MRVFEMQMGECRRGAGGGKVGLWGDVLPNCVESRSERGRQQQQQQQQQQRSSSNFRHL